MEAFEAYLDGLKQLADWRRQRLAPWSANVLAFAEMTDGVMWEGLLGWAANEWPGAHQVVEALRLMGAEHQAGLIADALETARERGHVGRAGLDSDAVLRDETAYGAFRKAEDSVHDSWAELWSRAEAYARASGWPETA